MFAYLCSFSEGAQLSRNVTLLSYSEWDLGGRWTVSAVRQMYLLHLELSPSDTGPKNSLHRHTCFSIVLQPRLYSRCFLTQALESLGRGETEPSSL